MKEIEIIKTYFPDHVEYRITFDVNDWRSAWHIIKIKYGGDFIRGDAYPYHACYRIEGKNLEHFCSSPLASPLSDEQLNNDFNLIEKYGYKLRSPLGREFEIEDDAVFAWIEDDKELEQRLENEKKEIEKNKKEIERRVFIVTFLLGFCVSSLVWGIAAWII